MPWYIALSGSIVIILICIYRRLNTGVTMLLGAMALGLLAGLPPADFLSVLVGTLLHRITIMLVISIILLGVLGYTLKETGSLDELITNLQALVSDLRVIAAAMPMLIGMIAVPGGAVLSAPLCAEAGEKIGLSPTLRAVMNNWFRHVLYFIFPLFPSMIIASELSGVSLGHFFLHNLPLTVVGSIFGFFYIFKGFAAGRQGPVFTFSLPRMGLLLRSILPLLVVLVLVVGLDVYYPLALLAGIAMTLLNYLPAGRRGPELLRRLRTMLLPGVKIQVALVIVGIMLYKEMLAKTGVIADMTGLILDLGLPVVLLIAVVSFLAGMLTGDNSASVAILFPLFVPLIAAGDFPYSAFIAFLYAGSTAGHIISPAHPCFSLTKEFYGVEMKDYMARSLPMLAVVMGLSLLITAVLGYVM